MGENAPPGLVGVPTKEWLWVEAVECLVALRPPAGSSLALRAGGSSVAYKREKLARAVLSRRGFRWLLFLDADMTFPPDVAQRLLAVDADIAAAPTTTRAASNLRLTQARFGGPLPEPVDPLRPTDRDDFPSLPIDPLRIDPDGAPFPVDLTGMAATLIHRRVFEGLDGPWFVPNERTRPGIGEDYNFCTRVRQAGFTIKVHPSVEVGHVGARAYGLRDAQTAALAVSGGSLEDVLALLGRARAEQAAEEDPDGPERLERGG